MSKFLEREFLMAVLSAILPLIAKKMFPELDADTVMYAMLGGPSSYVLGRSFVKGRAAAPGGGIPTSDPKKPGGIVHPPPPMPDHTGRPTS